MTPKKCKLTDHGEEISPFSGVHKCQNRSMDACLTALSKFRVEVENVLGDTKICRIRSDRYRNKRIRFNAKIRIIAGLVNLRNGFGGV
jgi:hypothetical protein